VISLPSEIQKGATWDGKTGFDPHLESTMDFDEHQRIAFAALQLLAGDLAVADNAAGAKLEALKAAYEGGSADDVLYISKGIHQPRTNPHMQLQLKRGAHVSYTYHLNVSTTDSGVVGLPESYFHWVGVQFTAEAQSVHGTLNACWPLVAARDMKGVHNRRRLSIAPENVQGKIEAIAQAAKEEQERADRVEQARLAESDKAKARNVLAAKLKAMNYTIPGNATSGLNKLIAGETIKIKTQRGKDISVKYVGTTVQNA